MSEPENILEARRWMKYAREDLQTADLILGHPTIAYRHVCWLSQQVVEKVLKAALIFLQFEFPRTHDLDVLRNLLPGEWEAKMVSPDLAVMTEWAVEARYPGDWPDATESDARTAYDLAKKISEAMEIDLGNRGLKA
jgi:HEPN domain-containing protein